MGVEFSRVEVFVHVDIRRVIKDFTLPKDLEIPFRVKQIKIVELSKEAISQGLALGNHFHTVESGRWELFIVDGPESDNLFKLRYRKAGQVEIREKDMKRGETCLVPPGHTHSFKGLQEGAVLVGFSNLSYDASHDVPDKLF